MQKQGLEPLAEHGASSLALACASGALATANLVCGLTGAWVLGLLVKPILIFQNPVPGGENRSQIAKALAMVAHLHDLFVLFTYGRGGFIIG